MKSFLLCFVPLFVAVDAIGVLPMFFGLTQGIPTGVVHRSIFQSVVTATIVALLFVAVGSTILKLLGITIADFMVAGGFLLFGLCIVDVLTTESCLEDRC